MAIAEMSKLKLVGLTAERNLILDALAKTELVEIKECSLIENTAFKKQTEDIVAVSEKLDRIEGSIAYLSLAVEQYSKAIGQKNCPYLIENFDVSYSDFMSAKESEGLMFSICDELDTLSSELISQNNEKIRLKALLNNLLPYKKEKLKFSHYSPTKFADVYYGTIPLERVADFTAFFEEADGVGFEVRQYENSAVVTVAVHKQFADKASALSSFGFVACPFRDDRTASDMIDECKTTIKETNKNIASLNAKIYSYGERLRGLKILADYYGFQKEKLIFSEEFPSTQTTFLMEAYVPKEAQNKVSCVINGVSEYIYFEFDEIGEDEIPPTLMKNNKVVRNFEFVTNMYTPPNYKEFDPNTILSLFFAIFLGFIMADIGYGLLMIAIGFFMGLRGKKDTGMKRLMLVIGYSGIFTVIFGVLFSSFFGFSSVPTDMNKYTISILPKPFFDTSVNWRLAGITVPSVLLISLIMGVVQLMASNACRAYQEFKFGKVSDGIFFGLIWVVFLIGLLLLVLGLIEELGLSYLTLPGAITAVASLLIAMLTAGKNVKGLGKFTKGFGAVYGIINYLSDILSYARLYGLMLSGAIIAQIASGQGFALLVGGNPVLAVVGVLVMIIGHGFNFAMGLLGGYIHDARLQYIEFFSRFYTGEGELFAPLGSKRKYISLAN